MFGRWRIFCASLGVDPSLGDIPRTEDRLCYILVFGMRYRQEGARGRSVRADTVDKALLAVGEGISHLGQPDPRKLSIYGASNHTLYTDFISSLRKEDDPSTRAYPANLTIVRQVREVLDFAHPDAGLLNMAVMDLIIIGYYWLLRPAEFLLSKDEGDGRSQSFRLQDLSIKLDGTHYLASTISLNDEDIARISHVTMTFSDQKNAVKGEQIGHNPTNHPFFCPCKALGRLVQRLRRRNAPADTPLHVFYDSAGRKGAITHTHVTNALRHAARSLERDTGIPYKLLSAKSLRPGGATALLVSGTDPDHIQLLGRWKSDAMLRYLRIAAATGPLSQRMLDHGDYTYPSGALTSTAPNVLPKETPPPIAAVLTAPLLFND